MTDRALEFPTVDVLMCAYNYGRYVADALESAVSQDYPEARLRVTVVDDGSTDDTARVVQEVARRNPGRVRLIQQENGGLRAAMNRALEAAEADLVALLDADDVWLPEKTRVQVRALQDDPQAGMAFCDMTVVDAQEQVVRPSQVGNIGDFPRQAFARLLVQNVATQSAIMLRRDLARPLPEGITYSDWWLALCAAETTSVVYLPDKLALYREHGANLTSSVTGAAAVREYRKELNFHLWTLRHLAIDGLAPSELQRVWQAVEFKAQRAVQANGSALVELISLDQTDREEAARLRDLAAGAEAEGDLQRSAVLLCRALAWDPLAVGARLEFDAAVQRAAESDAEPHPLADASGFVVLARAEDLLADRSMLAGYAEAATGLSDVTLAIDATRMPEDEAAPRLQAMLSNLGLDGRDDLDMLAVLGERSAPERFRMRARADVLYVAGAAAGPESGEAALSPETIDQLASVVRSRQALQRR